MANKLDDAIVMVIEGFKERIFIRSTKGDDDPNWTLYLLPYLSALAILQEHAEEVMK